MFVLQPGSSFFGKPIDLSPSDAMTCSSTSDPEDNPTIASALATVTMNLPFLGREGQSLASAAVSTNAEASSDKSVMSLCYANLTSKSKHRDDGNSAMSNLDEEETVLEEWDDFIL